MDSPIPAGQDSGGPLRDARSEAPDQHAEGARRAFLKAGLKGVLLLPYVVPLIESIHLSDAYANGEDDDDDDDDDDRGNTNAPAPSPIANLPPPPPSNTNSNTND